MPSGSDTVIEVALIDKTTVYGNMVLVPIKSPGRRKEIGLAEVVRTGVLVPATLVTVIVKAEGMAPTHCAIRLTKELEDWIKIPDMAHLIW